MTTGENRDWSNAIDLDLLPQHFNGRLGSLVNCNCYAQRLPPVVQFGLHFGAHNPHCPVYRPSRDAVDAKWDAAFRARHE